MKTLLLDASSVEAYLFCEKRFYIQHVLGRVSAEPGPAQRIGQAIHHMLAYRFRWPARFRLPVCERYFQRKLRGATDHRNADMALRVMQHLHQRILPRMDWEPVRSERGPLVEFRFVTPLTEDVFWHGIVDLVTMRNGELLVVDHKTTSAFWPRAWATDHQLLGYCWAIQQVTGMRCAGFTVNIIRITNLSPRDEDFRTETVLVTQSQLDDWRHNMAILARRIQREQEWPMRTTACWSRFGECPYYLACSAPPDQRTAILDSNLFGEKL